MKMINMQCLECKQESVQSVHFFDVEITKEEDACSFTFRYEARVKAKTMCPHCGRVAYHNFTEQITSNDIITLATRRKDMR